MSDAVKQRCDACRFYYHRECHKQPPARLPRKFDGAATAGNRVRDEELIWGWPIVGPTDWCGSFAPIVTSDFNGAAWAVAVKAEYDGKPLWVALADRRVGVDEAMALVREYAAALSERSSK